MQKATAVLLALFSGVGMVAQDRQGSICVDLAAKEPSQRSAFGLACDSGNYSFKIDEHDAASWPRQDRLKVTGLDLKTRHRVRIFCDGKPHQAFSFRFSELNADNLCLSIHDIYQTAQLWPLTKARWCGCQ